MESQLIQIINTRFSHLSGKDVVIYGMGQLASTLADNRDNLVFRIVGVMDKEKSEGSFKGITVVSTDNVHEVAKNIIIAALGSSCPLIYNRIAFLKDRGVDIFFPDGEKRSARVETCASKYFINIHERLVSLIDEHDIISFDVFDTLVMRKCLFPREVFSIIEERGSEQGFVGKRIEAEKQTASELGRVPTIYEIYEHMGFKSSDAEAEIELEREMLTARRDMLFFFEYAKKQGKTVVLTSDMYFPKTVMEDILAGCGITGYNNIYVSCDLNSTKQKGDIWREIHIMNPTGKILHIGDNATSDVTAHPYITCFLIKGTIEVADLLGFSEALNLAQNSDDYIAIGTVLAKLLTLDLTKVDDAGRIIIDCADDIGYCFIAPQTLSFVSWLAQTAVTNCEKKLYFCARDTYMLMRLYEKIRECYNAPPSQYLHISKRVMCGVLAGSLSNIRTCLEYYYPRVDSKTTVKEAIFRLFGVTLPADGFTSLLAKDVDTDTLFKNIKDLYLPLFQQEAKKEECNLNQYLKKHHINSRDLAFVDCVCGQSINLAKKIFCGRYYLYCLTNTALETVKSFENVYFWQEKVESLHIPYYHTTKYLQFIEAVYSSPEGTTLTFDEYGTPILDDEEKYFTVNDSIYMGVEAFWSEANCVANRETSDKIFGALFSGNYAINAAIKDMTWSSYTANKKGETLV